MSKVLTTWSTTSSRQRMERERLSTLYRWLLLSSSLDSRPTPLANLLPPDWANTYMPVSLPDICLSFNANPEKKTPTFASSLFTQVSS